jgi:hypothetical protein
VCIFPEQAAFLFILTSFFFTRAAASSLCLRQFLGEWKKTIFCSPLKKKFSTFLEENFQPFFI